MNQNIAHCLLPAELESSHGCGEDKGFLSRRGVVQPARWFLHTHPVSWTGGNEAQCRADGLANRLETGPGLLRKEKLYR